MIKEEAFAQVQQRLLSNQQQAMRSTQHEYLLRGLVSCGVCQLSCTGRQRSYGETRYRYYVCRGKQNPVGSCREERCPARFIPAEPLDQLVWEDLCQLLQEPARITQALERAQSGAWVPEELRRRQETLRGVRESLERQRERLLEAYLAEAIELSTFEGKDGELRQRQQDLWAQEREIEAQSQRREEISVLARSISEISQRLRAGLEEATFAQRRQLVELLIDRVVVTNGEVEIRYVIPTSEASLQTRFCHLRTDYFDRPPMVVPAPDLFHRRPPASQAPDPQRLGGTLPLPVALDLHHVERRLGVLLGVQAVPPPQADLAPMGVLDLHALRRCPPRRGLLEGEALPVLSGPTPAPIRSGSPIQHPVPSQPRHHDARLPLQRAEELMVAIAPVGGDHRPGARGLRRSRLTQRLHLGHPDRHGGLGRHDPARRERQRPTGPPLHHPGEQRVSVTGDDLSARAVNRVELTLGERLRLPMRPEGAVQGKHGLCGGGQRGGEQSLQGVQVQPPVVQRRVEAGPSATKHRRQAEFGERGHPGMDQEGIEQLEERVARPREDLAINRLPKLLQPVTLYGGGTRWLAHTSTFHRRAVRSLGEPPFCHRLV